MTPETIKTRLEALPDIGWSTSRFYRLVTPRAP